MRWRQSDLSIRNKGEIEGEWYRSKKDCRSNRVMASRGLEPENAAQEATALLLTTAF